LGALPDFLPRLRLLFLRGRKAVCRYRHEELFDRLGQLGDGEGGGGQLGGDRSRTGLRGRRISCGARNEWGQSIILVAAIMSLGKLLGRNRKPPAEAILETLVPFRI
jgi:hypothetical protein